MKAKHIMTQDVATIRGSATVAQAVKLMRLKELRALVVEPRHSGDAYGLVTEMDIVGKVAAYGEDPEQVCVYEVMTKPCVVVNPDLDIEYVARLFANTGVWRAPVIQGDLLGIISVTDILTKGNFVDKPRLKYLRSEIQKAIADAVLISTNYGADSKRAIEAWDLVDELQAEATFYGLPKYEKSARQMFSQEGKPMIAKV